MLTDCNSLVTVCASKTSPKPSPLDPMQPVMERSHPTSGRSATPADINRNGRPTSIGTSGRHQSECPADIIGMRTGLQTDTGIERNAGFPRACGQLLQAAPQRRARRAMGALLQLIGEGSDQQIATEA